MKKFTIEEIRNYLVSQDSRGDIMYNLSEENIINANKCGDNEYGQFLCNEIDDAISQFGIHTYQDKGANEVMFVEKYLKYLCEQSTEEIISIFKYLIDNNENYGELMEELLYGLEDRDDFDEILDADERFEY